ARCSREREAPDADGARDRGAARRDRLVARLGVGHCDLGGELRVLEHELAVDLQRSAAARLVQEGENEGGDLWAGDALILRLAERLLDQRLHVVDALVRRTREDERRVAAELPVGPGD